MEQHRKREGRRLDHEERERKKEARSAHKKARFAKKVLGIKAKLHAKQRHAEKVQMKKLIKQHEEEAGRWQVPLPKVRPIAEDEMFRVLRSGKRRKKQWRRVITKATFVGSGFTRKHPKYERFIRPSGLRFKKAHVTHPELKCTFQLEIIGVKKNPNGSTYTQMGVLTKGTIIEVNVSELGLVTPGGKVVWGKYAQVTNNPENDGCV